jgi:hypothetical protein
MALSTYQDANVVVVGTPLQRSKAVWVGSAGTLTVTIAGTGATIVFGAVPAGTLLPIEITGVTAFSGTAGTLIALR